MEKGQYEGNNADPGDDGKHPQPEINACYEAGMTGHVNKPVALDELAKALEHTFTPPAGESPGLNQTS